MTTKPIIPTYSAAAYAMATSALFAPANGVAAAMAKAEGPKAAWAAMSAVALLAKDVPFTIADVAMALVTAAQGTLGKRKAASITSITDMKALGGGFATVAGWYYDLRKAERGGLLPLLLEGHSLTGLRRAVQASEGGAKPQRQPRHKGGSGPAVASSTPTPTTVNVTAPTSLGDIAAQLEADAKRLSIKALRNQQADLARIIQAASAMVRRVEAAIARTPAAKKVARAA